MDREYNIPHVHLLHIAIDITHHSSGHVTYRPICIYEMLAIIHVITCHFNDTSSLNLCYKHITLSKCTSGQPFFYSFRYYSPLSVVLLYYCVISSTILRTFRMLDIDLIEIIEYTSYNLMTGW